MAGQVSALPDARSPAVDAAITAWTTLTGVVDSCLSASIVSDSEKSIVIRLDSRADGPGAIIAKRCARAVVLREAYLYQHLLPAAGVVAPRFFGVGRDTQRSLAWLFIGDAPGVQYDMSQPKHAALAAHWLASLHASLRDGHAGAALRLPPHDAAIYLAHLRQSRGALQQRVSTTRAESEDWAILRRGIDICDQLESCWPQIIDLSRILPATLVHGDLAPENVRIAGEDVHVFDWEKAGWGTPVVDIARIDLGAYSTRACALWSISAADVARAASCGAIFRTLSHRWAAKPVRDVALYRRRLLREMRIAGLTGDHP